jgi:hypothetical protein
VGVGEAAGVDFITSFESELSRLPLYATSNTYFQQEVLLRLHLFLFPGNRHVGYSFRGLFHNRLDSHRNNDPRLSPLPIR